MATTATAAIDEMFETVKTVFDSVAAPLLGYDPDVRWPGVPVAAKPDRSKFWSRVSSQLVTDEQSALANASQLRLFEATGMLYVQLFCPRNIGGSIDSGRSIAIALQTALRKASPDNEVWYRKAKSVELPEDDASYPILVSVQYTYKTISSLT